MHVRVAQDFSYSTAEIAVIKFGSLNINAMVITTRARRRSSDLLMGFRRSSIRFRLGPRICAAANEKNRFSLNSARAAVKSWSVVFGTHAYGLANSAKTLAAAVARLFNQPVSLFPLRKKYHFSDRRETKTER